MTPFEKDTVTVTITNNVTAHAESITLSVGVHQGAFDEMMLELRKDLEEWIRPDKRTPGERWAERMQQYHADNPETSDT